MFRIDSPAQLKSLSMAELIELAEDIRQRIVSVCLTNGGHLGASLGAVELAISLHYCFDSPEEPLIWDVGHQAYAHKLVTGRWEQFSTLRQKGGISGFLSRTESPHDLFGAGHSSTSISAALATAWNRRATDRWTVAVIGDGALGSGLAFEALNQARSLETGPLAIVLNDNQMSISPNVGSISQILAEGRGREFFDLMGFDFLGPLGGHDLNLLIGTFRALKERRPTRPLVVHVLTQKGRGYLPAEELPQAFHGISPISGPSDLKVPSKNEPQTKTPRPSYSQAFCQSLIRMAEKDPSIVAITAAMTEGTGLTEFARRFPDRFFDVGIAEPHAVTFAAGLATQGHHPVVAVYSTFLQRALDSIIHDVTLQKLPVTFAVDRAGLVGSDGPTHHGLFDLPYFGMLPGMRIFAPSTGEDFDHLLRRAREIEGPAMIRYPRGRVHAPTFPKIDPEGVRWHSRPTKPTLIAIALGHLAEAMFRAVLSIDPKGERILLVSLVQLKPLSDHLLNVLRDLSDLPILIAEPGQRIGGVSEHLLSLLEPRAGKIRIQAYGDRFLPHGDPSELDDETGHSPAKLKAAIEELLA